ncbi:MAG: hypothetical protein OHK0013_19730 [Sandaracinaceae bacterium]
MTRRSDILPSVPETPANGPPEAPIVCERDPISPFCHDVLALFRGSLAEVRFPDLDRTDLEAHARRTLEAQHEVESLERALEAARARTVDAQQALSDRASRALAYARVFAIGQPELEAELATVRAPAIRADRPATASSSGALASDAPRKRGRPRKDAGMGALLPMASEPEPTAVAE